MTAKGLNKELIEALVGKKGDLRKARVVAGFDGFIDSLYRIDNAQHLGNGRALRTIGDFGAYIQSKRDRSFSLEMERITVKPGGNMPNFSQALGGLGCRIFSVGALGYPRVNGLFKSIGGYGRAFSFSEPGSTIGIEFEDGKVMLYTSTDKSLGWRELHERVVHPPLRRALRQCDLLAALNMGEMKNSLQIWSGFLREMISLGTSDSTVVLFDLSDCTRRRGDELRAAFDVMREYAKNFRVALSMNENEARYAYSVLTGDTTNPRIRDVGTGISGHVALDWLVIHPINHAYAWNDGSVVSVPNRLIEKPAISTGGGDNFNAGLCAGLLLGLPVELTLICANALSGFYVERGRSPRFQELIDYLESTTVECATDRA